AEPFQPHREPLPAAVDDHEPMLARLRGDAAQGVVLLGEGLAAELDDDGVSRGGAGSRPLARQPLAHVLYAEFSSTYCSVRSQPKASPRPSPSPRSSRSSTSVAAIDCESAALSNGSGSPSKTGTPAMPIASRSVSTGTAPPASVALPAAAAIRPQFGSRPCIAALTRLLRTTSRATARACA